jgi:nucleotide-binding universal stress UspA family protein
MTLQPDLGGVSAVLPQRILVAFDGSPCAEYAFEVALSLAALARARLGVTHVGLIVVGHRGRSRISQWVCGSVSKRIVNHALCSVLVARHPQ